MIFRTFLLLGSAALLAASASAEAPLTLAGATSFPNYSGDFDHFAIDRKDNTMFLAGEENHELEVMNLTTGAIKARLKGFGAPHSVFYMAARNELLVIDGEKPSKVFDAKTLKVKRSYTLPAGADSVGIDGDKLWVVTGGKDVPQKDSNLIQIDPATGKTLKTVHFDADHVEAMAVEQHGPHLYINVTDKNYLAVVDKASAKVVAQWHIKEAEQNAPIAIDEEHHRLFVITRGPGKMIVLNADTGETITTFKAPERCDEVVWDAVTHRVYVAGGEGYISVVQQDTPDIYREIAKIKSLPGAKTAIVDHETSTLWVAASPGETKAMAKVLRFKVNK